MPPTLPRPAWQRVRLVRGLGSNPPTFPEPPRESFCLMCGELSSNPWIQHNQGVVPSLGVRRPASLASGDHSLDDFTLIRPFKFSPRRTETLALPNINSPMTCRRISAMVTASSLETVFPLSSVHDDLMTTSNRDSSAPGGQAVIGSRGQPFSQQI